MYSRETLHFALGVLGNIASCAFYLSSAPTICSVIRKKSTGNLAGDLYVFMLFNCLLWLFYGLPIIHPNDFWVLVTNACGAALAILYIIPYVYYGSKRQRCTVMAELGTTSSLIALMVGLVMEILHPQAKRIMVVGTVCAIISSIMHLSLLSQMKLLLDTKDPTYMYPYSSLGAFLKGAIWAAYGVIDFDLHILIPNSVGIMIGVFQLILYLVLTRMRCVPNTLMRAQGDHGQNKHAFDQKSPCKWVSLYLFSTSTKVRDFQDCNLENLEVNMCVNSN